MCVLLPSGETQNYVNIRKERSRLWDRSQDRFCIKLYIIFYETTFVILLYGSTTVIRTKTLFFNTGEITNFSCEIQNPKHYFFLPDEIATKFQLQIQNSRLQTLS